MTNQPKKKNNLPQALESGKVPAYLTSYEVQKYGLDKNFLTQLGWTTRKVSKNELWRISQSEPDFNHEFGDRSAMDRAAQAQVTYQPTKPLPTTLPDTWQKQANRGYPEIFPGQANAEQALKYNEKLYGNMLQGWKGTAYNQAGRETKGAGDFYTQGRAQYQMNTAVRQAVADATQRRLAAQGGPEWSGPPPGTEDYKGNVEAWRENVYRQQFDQTGQPNNKVVGPNGDELPNGAYAWDYEGNPYYGDGFSGFWRRYWYKFQDMFEEPNRQGSLMIDTPKLDFGTERPQVGYSTGNAIDPERLMGNIGEIGRSIGATWDNINHWNGLWGIPAFGARMMSATGMFVAESIDALGDPARWLERAAGVQQGVENLGEGSFLPNITDWGRPDSPYRGLDPRDYTWRNPFPGNSASMQTAREIDLFVGNEILRPAVSWFESLLEILPTTQVYNQFRFWTQPERVEKLLSGDFDLSYEQRVLQEEGEAGRIKYSSAVDPMLREEFIRRLRAGENPYLLEKELQKLFPEIAGQVVLDPLNVLTDYLNWEKLSRGVNQFQDYMKVAPEIEKVLGQGSFENQEVQAIKDAIGAVKKIVSERTQVIEDMQKAPTTLKDFFKLTPAGQRWVMTQRVGTFLDTIVANVDSTDDAIDFLRAIAKLSSGNDGEIAEAMTVLARFKGPGMIYSNAGTDASILLNTMLGENHEDMWRTIAKIAQDATDETGKQDKVKFIQGVSEFLTKKLDAANTKLFPDLADRIKPGSDMVAKLPWHTRSMVEFQGIIDKFYKPLNRFFAGVYMGMSPAYAARNAMTNFVHVAIDEGVVAALSNPAKLLQEQAQLLGGDVSRAMQGLSGGTQGAVEDLKPGSKFWSLVKLGPIGISEKAETKAAIQVTTAAIKDVMKKVLVEGRAIPDTRELVAAGLSRDAAQMLISLVQKHGGDIETAATEFITLAAKGSSINVMETMAWLGVEQKEVLDNFHLTGELQRAVERVKKNGGTAEDAIREARKILRKQERAAFRTNDEVRSIGHVALDMDGVEIQDDARAMINDLGGAHNAGDIPPSLIDPATDYINANELSMGAYNKLGNDFLQYHVNTTDAEVPGISQVKIRLNQIVSGNTDEARAAKSFQNGRREQVLRIREWVRHPETMPSGTTIDGIWHNVLHMPKELPVPGTMRELVEQAWEKAYFVPVREQWNKVRNMIAAEIEEAIKMFPLSQEYLTHHIHAQDMLLQAYAYDFLLRGDEVGKWRIKAIASSDYALYARATAHTYGLPTAISDPALLGTGPNLDQTLLNTINKYAGTEFKSLSDVPISTTDEALQKYWKERMRIKTPDKVPPTPTAPPPAPVAGASAGPGAPGAPGAGPDAGEVKISNAQQFRDRMREAAPGLREDRYDAMAKVVDARANTWAVWTGRDPDEWYRLRLQDMQQVSVEQADALKRAGAMDVKFDLDTRGEQLAETRRLHLEYQGVDVEAKANVLDSLGTTDDIGKSGWILDDGALLDMSFGYSHRTMVHGEVFKYVVVNGVGSDADVTRYSGQLKEISHKLGALRVDKYQGQEYSKLYLEAFQPLTSKQKRALKEIYDAGVEIVVDISNFNGDAMGKIVIPKSMTFDDDWVNQLDQTLKMVYESDTPIDALRKQDILYQEQRLSNQKIKGMFEKLVSVGALDIKEEEIDVAAALMEANARYLGLHPDDYADQFLGEFVFGGEIEPDALLAQKVGYNEYWVRSMGMDMVTAQQQDYLLANPQLMGIDDSDYFREVVTNMKKGFGATGDNVFRGNEKTAISIDISGNCPFRQNGRPCLYCYVEAVRSVDDDKANLVYDHLPFIEGSLRNTWGKSPEGIQWINNRMGGLRVYSIGDFRPEDAEIMDKIVAEAGEIGLKLKFITKQEDTILRYIDQPHVQFNLSVDWTPDYFGQGHASVVDRNLRAYLSKDITITNETLPQYLDEAKRAIARGRYTGIDTSNLEKIMAAKKVDKNAFKAAFIDYTTRKATMDLEDIFTTQRNVAGYGFDINEAYKWHKQYPEKIRIRYVAMNRDEGIMALMDKRVHVLTMYHGRVDPGQMLQIWRRQNPYLTGMGTRHYSQAVSDIEKVLKSKGVLLPDENLVDIIERYRSGMIADWDLLKRPLGEGTVEEMQKVLDVVRMSDQEATTLRYLREVMLPKVKEHWEDVMHYPLPENPNMEELMEFFRGVRRRMNDIAPGYTNKSAKEVPDWLVKMKQDLIKKYGSKEFLRQYNDPMIAFENTDVAKYRQAFQGFWGNTSSDIDRLRDKGTSWKLRTNVPGTTDTGLGPTSRLDEFLKDFASPQAEHGYLPERTLQALASSFETTPNPGKWVSADLVGSYAGKWVPAEITDAGVFKGKKSVVPNMVSRRLTPEDIERVLNNTRIEGQKYRKVSDAEFNYWLEEALQKLCCITGRCSTCNTSCGFACRPEDYEAVLPDVLGRIMDGEPMASVAFREDGRAVMRALSRNTNITDLLHETGHIFRHTLKQEDLQQVERILGVVDGTWTRKHEELFVRQFEEYLRKGRAPTQELQPIFDRIVTWLQDLWRGLKDRNFRVQVNPELEAVFNRMLGGDLIDASDDVLFSMDNSYLSRMPGFENFFTGSKVVDETGQAKIMYHGSSNIGFDTFKTQAGIDQDALYGPGAYFTDSSEVASSYTEKGKIEKVTEWELGLDGRNLNVEQTRSYREKYAAMLDEAKGRYAEVAKRKGATSVPAKNLKYQVLLMRDHLDIVDIYLRNDMGLDVFAIEKALQAVEPEDANAFMTLDKGIQIALKRAGVPFKHSYPPGIGVFPVVLNVRNPFRVNGEMPVSLIDDLEALLQKRGWSYSRENMGKWREYLGPNGLARWNASHPGEPLGHALYRYLEDIGSNNLGRIWGDEVVELFGTNKPSNRTFVNYLLREVGFDGINHEGGKVVGGLGDHDVWIAFDPGQVKSVFNSGAFDPTKSSILAQEESPAKSIIRGFASFDKEDGGRAFIGLVEGRANVSTVMHELAHVFRRDLYKSLDEAVDDTFRGLIQNDIYILEEWLGVSGTWTRDQEEKFSRAFERYLYDGKTEVPELRNVFERFRDWLHNIWQGVKGTDIEADVPADVKLVFDDMLQMGPRFPVPQHPPMSPSAVPTDARVLAENLRGLKRTWVDVERSIRNQWNNEVPTQWSPDIVRSLNTWKEEGKGRIAIGRQVAKEVAAEARKFTLLNYPEKTWADVAMAYVYPYQFWYNRTYQNWIKRAATNPTVLANYARYRESLETLHAGMPEWWKYNISSNELLGINSKNPFFFNLEATLNPLQGIMGVDFNDPLKRQGMAATILDDMNKIGPSVWTPFQWAMALSLAAQGENDAAERWVGRLFPQTVNLKNALTLAGVKASLFGRGFNEFDPFVLAFNNGYDPYERRRIGRSMAIMVETGEVSQEDAIDAVWRQSGEYWDLAAQHASMQRAGNPGLMITNFMLGVGFKPRSVTDMQIDMFDQEYRRLWAMRPELSPQDFQNQMTALGQKYPFMDTVILSRKSGVQRDRQYVYNVLSRIPPGQSDEISKLYGLDYKLVQHFYDTKGAMETWAENDKTRFMASINDIAAVMELPDTATRQEWNYTSQQYKRLQESMHRMFGDDIEELIDVYFQVEIEDRDEFLAAHPEVEMALDYSTEQKFSNPALAPYYSSIDKVKNYYTSVMYDAIRSELGKDIWEKWDMYTQAKLISAKDGKQYWKDHPELERYMELKDRYNQIIANAIVRISQQLEEPTMPGLRGPGDSIGSENLYQQLVAPREPTAYDYTWDDFSVMMSEPLQRLVFDYLYGGEALPSVAESELQRIADELGITLDSLLILLRQTSQQ